MAKLLQTNLPFAQGENVSSATFNQLVRVLEINLGSVDPDNTLQLTTAERDTLNFNIGQIIYNTSTTTLQYWDGSTFQNISSTGAVTLNITDGSSNIAIDLFSETLSLLGGTGITSTASGNGVSFAIDSTVATLVGSQTLTNKTIDVDNNTLSNIEVDNFKASAIVTESEGIASNDNDTSLPTSAAVKDFVDTQITAEDLDVTDGSSNISIDLDSEVLGILGGTGLTSSASGNNVTLSVDASQAQITTVGTLDSGAISSGFGAIDIGSSALTAGTGTFSSNVTISGDLTVSGTTTTINTTNLEVKDKNITLNFGAGDTSSNANGAGITIQDAVDASTDATILWNASADRFDFSHGLRINADNQVFTVGAGGDFALSHNGTDTFMANNTGHFYITTTSDNKDIVFRSDDGSGGVTAYMTVNGFTENVIFSKNLKLQDNVKATFGDSDDLEIFHNGANSVINDAGTGDLIFQIAGSEKGRITSTAFSFQGGYSATGSFNTTLGAYQINGTTVIDSSRNLIPNEIFLPQKITHFGDNDTHIQFPSDDTFTITTAGTERMRVDSGGKLLVGKTTADATNTVGHELKANGIAVHTTDDTGTMFLNRKTSHGKIIELRKDNSAVGVIGTQNWGIGTSSPSTNLHISSTTPKVRLTDSDTNADSDISASSSNGSLFLSADTNDEVANTVLAFQVDGTTKFYVGTDGFYAIGTKIIDASTRNLLNIGTISSGTITSSGNIDVNSDSGQLQFGADNDMQIFHNGAIGEINIATGDFLVDSVGDITLDAAGNDWNFNSQGGNKLKITNASGDVVLAVGQQDKDLIFKGNDGGSEITALTLDMSAGGDAFFAGNISINDNKSIGIGTANDMLIKHDGSNTIFKEQGDGNVIFEVTDATIQFKKGTTETIAEFAPDSGVLLYHDNTLQLATTSDGASTSGFHNVGSGYRVGGTQIIDSSRNISNIGTITASGDMAIDTNALFVDVSANRVGINTSSPDGQLDVRGSSISTILARATSSNSQARVMVQNDARAYSFKIHTNDELQIKDETADTPRIKISTGGNVSIGGDPNPGGTTATLSLGPGSNATESLVFAPATGGVGEFRNTSSSGFFKFTKTNGTTTIATLNTGGSLDTLAGYSIGTTQVIDSSRNIVNIGTVSSGAITANTGASAAIPLIIGSGSSTNYTLQRWITSAHSGNSAYILAYGASHSSQAGNFAMKNVVSGGEIFFELASGVEPLRLTSTGATFASDITLGANGAIDTASGNIKFKSIGSTVAQFISSPQTAFSMQGAFVATGFYNTTLGGYQINGTTVIDNSRNLTNIGTISIGGVTVTSTAAELNKLDGFTGTVADLNYAKDLRATGVTATEFDFLDGVTSNIQTQIDAVSTVTINNNADNRLITGSGTAQTLNAESTATFASGRLTIATASGGSSTNQPSIILTDTDSTLQQTRLKQIDGVTTLTSQNGSGASGAIRFVGVSGVGSQTNTQYGGFDASGNFEIGTTDVIDTSRNLTNIGTISSGTITSSGNIDVNSDSGQLQFGADNDMQIFHNGANGEINNATGNFTIDSAGDISLDADGGDIRFVDGGTIYGNLANESGNFAIKAVGQDKDIRFKGNDGGSVITALSLDMSASGAATFNDQVTIGGNLIHAGNLTIDAGGDITLDADGQDILFKDAGTQFGSIRKNGNNLQLMASIQDGDITFHGDDGGSAITALTLDMSAGGNATFAGDITSSGKVKGTNMEILGASGSSGFLYIFDSDNGTSNTDGFLLQKSGNNAFVYNRESSGSLSLGAGNTSNYLVIDSSGNIDLGSTQILDQSRNLTNIGTISSGAITTSGQLELQASTPSIHFLDTDDNSDGYIQANAGTLRFYADDANEVGGSIITFNIDGGEKMRLDNAGSLAVGNTSPSSFWGQANKLVLDASGNTGMTIKSTSSGNGRIVFTDQSSSNPGLSDGGQIHYGHSADDMRFRTAGADRVTIDSSGNVGIGTTSPSQKLNVDGNIRVGSTDKLYFGGTTNYVSGSHGSNYLHFFTNNSERVRINSSGNVGIGTTSPNGKLDVFTGTSGNTRDISGMDNGSIAFANASSSTAAPVITGRSNNNVGIILQAATNNTNSSGDMHFNVRENDGTDFSTTSSPAFKFQRFATDLMTIRRDGNVGIGLTSPSVPLEVAGNIKVNAGNGSGFVLNSSSTTGIFRQNANDLGFTVGGSERLRINASGNVGISTTNPIANLQVGDGTGSETLLLLGSNSNTTSSQILFGDNTSGADPFEFGMGIRYDSSNNVLHFDDNFNNSGSANNAIMSIDRDDQRVGIGTTSPSHTLDVVGNVEVSAGIFVANGAGISQFSCDHATSNADDWQISPISIRERGLVGSAQSANSYSPNLNFHWASRVARSLTMLADGSFVLGEWVSTGSPSTTGSLSPLNTGGYRVGGTDVITSSRNIQNIGSYSGTGSITTSAGGNAITTSANAAVFAHGFTSGSRGFNFESGDESMGTIRFDANSMRFWSGGAGGGNERIRINDAATDQGDINFYGSIDLEGVNLRVSGTNVLDSSRNLQNINSLSMETGIATAVAKTFSLPNTSGNSDRYIKFGTLSSLSQSGQSVTLRIHSNVGYNASDAQNQETLVRFKTSNGSSNQSGFYGDCQVYYFGSSTGAPSSVVVKQVSTTEYEFYGVFGNFTGTGSFYTVEHRQGTWTNSATDTGTSAPTGTVLTATERVIFTSGTINQSQQLQAGSLSIGSTNIVDGSRNLVNINSLSVAGSILHTGDTDTSILFATDTIQLKTSNAMRIQANNSAVTVLNVPFIISQGNGAEMKFFQTISSTSASKGSIQWFDSGGNSCGTINLKATGENNSGVMEFYVTAESDELGDDPFGINKMMSITENGVQVHGSLSKSSGSFKIDHPLKPDTHDLVHSFVEGPQADNLYRGTINLEDGKAIIDLDEWFGMTPGTFLALNRDIQAFVSNIDDWDPVRAKMMGSQLIIECQNTASKASVSWLVVGERQDKEIYASKLTDDNGKIIVEPLKEVVE